LLSAVYRWEFTRRHPYYLQHWQLAQAYFQDATLSPAERTQAACSVALLAGALSWAGDYFAPTIDGRQQAAADPHLDLVPCACPVTLRSLVFTRLLGLPADLRAALAAILLDQTPEGADLALGHDDLAYHWKRRRALERLEHPLLDEVRSGLVALDPEAPLRAIQEAVTRLVQTRRRQDNDSRRVAPSTLDAYLAVWDLREGWVDGQYEASREQRLGDIARQLKASVPTVQSRYCAAFRYLTGHDYTPDLWAILFGPWKASRWASWRRSKQPSESVRAVPASLLQPTEGRASGVLGGLPAPESSSLEDQELVWDIRALLAQGRTDGHIAEELDCPAELVAWFRERLHEPL
jgi:hypothetical protein